MKITFSHQQQRRKGLWTAVVVIVFGLASAAAQSVVAITEVMSSAARTYGTNTVRPASDWVEFTVFGTHLTNLAGWHWTDSGGTVMNYFSNLEIRPGESVIFFKTGDTPTVEKFQEWWGDCLRTTNIFPFDKPGLSGSEDGDAVRLYDPQDNLVDEAVFGQARVGTTFVSDPDTGDFGVFSRLGDCGTCRGATADDIGSPGTNCSPVLLRIVEQPTSLSDLCSGLNAVFWVRAFGLPRPKYQWQFKPKDQYQWLPIPGANGASVTITNVLASDEGEYRVVVTNGLDMVISTNAWLTVDTNSSPPRLLSQFTDLERFVGESARFTAQVCAFPRPKFQWYSNGAPIVDATNWALVFPEVTPPMSGTAYSVSVTNVLGWTNASARLLVYPWPTLAITEAMPATLSHGQPGSYPNWWELTNLGTNAVKLRKGFRHGDTTLRNDAKVVNHDVLLQAGESVIFVDGMTRAEFVRWWGESNLPPALQVIAFVGYGLNNWSDVINVWSDAAETNLASVMYAAPDPLAPFPTCPCDCLSSLCDLPISGHSLFFSPNQYDCAFWGPCSEENVNGAFRAQESDDVGSPGWTEWTPPCWTSIHCDPSGVVLAWRAVPGSLNWVQYNQSLENPNWATLGSVATGGASRTFTDIGIGTGEHRYYRILSLPSGQVSEVALGPPPRPPSIVPTRSPRLPCGLTLILTWPTEPPYPYVLQYRTDLASGAWASLCTNVATNGSMSLVDPIPCDTLQRFYRVMCPLVCP